MEMQARKLKESSKILTSLKPLGESELNESLHRPWGSSTGDTGAGLRRG